MASGDPGAEPEWTKGVDGATEISLSGGGLRAASFALGVLQVLQERRGLVYGHQAAHYHPTWRQVYNVERMRSYIGLGRENAARSLEEGIGHSS